MNRSLLSPRILCRVLGITVRFFHFGRSDLTGWTNKPGSGMKLMDVKTHAACLVTGARAQTVPLLCPRSDGVKHLGIARSRRAPMTRTTTMASTRVTSFA